MMRLFIRTSCAHSHFS